MSRELSYQFSSHNKGKTEVVKFDSPNHMINVVEDGYDNKGWDNKGFEKGMRFDTKNRRDMQWTWGNEYYEDIDKTKELIRNGDICDKHYEKIKSMLDKVTNSQSYQKMSEKFEKRRKAIYAEEGDDLSIDRLMSGDPMHWQKVTRNPARPLFRIAVNSGGHCMQDEDYYLKVATVSYIISTLKHFENKAVEVDLVYSTKEPTYELESSFIFVNIKQANERIDLKKVCLPVIQGIQRAYTFAVKTNILTGKPDSGLGRPLTFKNQIDSDQYDMIIDAVELDKYPDLVKYVEEKLK